MHMNAELSPQKFGPTFSTRSEVGSLQSAQVFLPCQAGSLSLVWKWSCEKNSAYVSGLKKLAEIYLWFLAFLMVMNINSVKQRYCCDLSEVVHAHAHTDGILWAGSLSASSHGSIFLLPGFWAKNPSSWCWHSALRPPWRCFWDAQIVSSPSPGSLNLKFSPPWDMSF